MTPSPDIEKVKPTKEYFADGLWGRKSYIELLENVVFKHKRIAPEIQLFENGLKKCFASDNIHIGIRFDLSTLETILTSGRFMSQFETGTSNASFDPEYRAQIEYDEMSYPKDEVTMRPVYGFILQYDNVKDVDFKSYSSYDKDMAIYYGDVVAIFKQDVKRYTTITNGDSMEFYKEHKKMVEETWGDITIEDVNVTGQNYYIVPTPLLAPKFYSFITCDFYIWSEILEKIKNNQDLNIYKIMPDSMVGYLEAQIHQQQATVNNIERIIFTKGINPNKIPKDLLKKYNIKWNIEGQDEYVELPPELDFRTLESVSLNLDRVNKQIKHIDTQIKNIHKKQSKLGVIGNVLQTKSEQSNLEKYINLGLEAKKLYQDKKDLFKEIFKIKVYAAEYNVFLYSTIEKTFSSKKNFYYFRPYLRAIAKAPMCVRKVWNLFEDKLTKSHINDKYELKDENAPIGYYDYDTKIIYINIVKDDVIYSNFSHALFNFIDDDMNNYSSSSFSYLFNNGAFERALRNDFQKYCKKCELDKISYKEKIISDIALVINDSSKDIDITWNYEKLQALSDIFNGLTNGEFALTQKNVNHGKEYWETSPDKFSKESFANIGVITVSCENNDKLLRLLKHFFPTGYKEFENILNAIIETKITGVKVPLSAPVPSEVDEIKPKVKVKVADEREHYKKLIENLTVDELAKRYKELKDEELKLSFKQKIPVISEDLKGQIKKLQIFQKAVLSKIPNTKKFKNLKDELKSYTPEVSADRMPFSNPKAKYRITAEQDKPENRIEAAKQGTIFAYNLGRKANTNDVDAIIRLLEKAPENMRVVWNLYENKIYFETVNGDIEDSQYSLGIKTNIAEDGKGAYDCTAPYAATIHESMHAIDNAAVGYEIEKNANNQGFHHVGISEKFDDNAFLKALRKDAENYINKWKERIKKAALHKGYTEKQANTLAETKWRAYLVNELKQKYEKYQQKIGCYLDIWDSLLGGYIYDKTDINIGHGKKYWAEDESKISSEAFANMGGSMVTNSEEWGLIKEDFPLSVAVFNNILDYLAENRQIVLTNNGVQVQETVDANKFLGGLFKKKPVEVKLKEPDNLQEAENNLRTELITQWEEKYTAILKSLKGNNFDDVAKKLSQSLGTDFFDKERLQQHVNQVYALGKRPYRMIKPEDKEIIDGIANRYIALIKQHYDKHIKPIVNELISKNKLDDLKNTLSDTKYFDEIIKFALAKVHSLGKMAGLEAFGHKAYEIKVPDDELKLPTCSKMNGVAFSIADTRKFFNDTLKIEDPEKFHEILKSDIKLPPYHMNCHCYMVGTDISNVGASSDITEYSHDMKALEKEFPNLLSQKDINIKRKKIGHQTSHSVTAQKICEYYRDAGREITTEYAEEVRQAVIDYTYKHDGDMRKAFLKIKDGIKLTDVDKKWLRAYDLVAELCRIAPVYQPGDGETEIYRGIGNKGDKDEYTQKILALKPGDIWDFERPVSFSSEEEAAKEFTDKESDVGEIRIVFHVANDDIQNVISITGISHYGMKEHEILVYDRLYEVIKIETEDLGMCKVGYTESKNICFHVYIKRIYAIPQILAVDTSPTVEQVEQTPVSVEPQTVQQVQTKDTNTIRSVPIETINRRRHHLGHLGCGQLTEEKIKRFYNSVGIFDITDDEVEKVHKAIEKYTKPGVYTYIRNLLFDQLEGKKMSSESQYILEKFINPIQEFCNIAPTFDGSLEIYRGIPLKNIRGNTDYSDKLLALKPGDDFDLQILSSFSSEYRIAQTFAKQNGIILHVPTIDIINSVSIQGISTIQSEMEVLVNDLSWIVEKIKDERIKAQSLLFYHYHIYLRRKK